MDPSFERAGERKNENTRLRERRENRGQTSGARQSPFSREEEREDLDLHTSNLIPLTSVPHAVHRPSKERERDPV